MASVRAEKSGFGKDMRERLSAKYDPELAEQCLLWIKDSINANLQGDEEPVDFNTCGDAENLSATLHNGVILARMTNVLIPGSVSRNKYSRPPTLAFKQMELIEGFIRKAKEFGVPDHECFQTVDLFEDQNLHQVTICLHSVGRKSKAKGLNGFGPAESQSNKREFTQEQIRAGQGVIGLQMGTNKGASQAGMTFGKQRHIID